MSQITENTILFDKNKKDKFFEEVNNSHERISGVKIVYESKKNSLIVATFDCNGTPLYLSENFAWFVLETNYLDEEEIITLQWGKGEVEKRASRIIKSLIGLEEFEKIKGSLIYADGRL